MFKYIEELKNNYNHPNNTILMSFPLETRDSFLFLLEELKKYKNTIQIFDYKVYKNNNHYLLIDDDGNMECYQNKILNYSNFENKKITLLNKRKLLSENFNTCNIEDEYKQKQLIYKYKYFTIILKILLIKVKNPKKNEDKVITNYVLDITYNSQKNLLSDVKDLLKSLKLE